MMLDMQLCSFRGVMCRVMQMPLSGVRVMRGCLVVAAFMVLGGFAMVPRSVLVVFRCFVVMLCGMFRHFTLLRAKGSCSYKAAKLESGGYGCVTTA
jgi:hypothetical protein